MRRYDQRNTSATNSAYAALISNMYDKDRAKDVEQFDDNLRTFVNGTNRFENRFGTIRDEEKTLKVKKFMPERLLNCRFRGTTMSYSELLVALENIIFVKVVTVPTARNRTADTNAPMEIGMAAKDNGESEREAGDQRIVDLAPQAVYKRTGKGKWGFGEGQSWNGKGYQRWQRRQRWRKELVAEGQRQQRQQGARERWQGENQSLLDVWKRQDKLQRGVEQGGTRMCVPLMKKTVNLLKKQLTTKKICKHGACWRKAKMSSGRRRSADERSKKMMKAYQASLLSVEISHNSNSKEIVEVKDRWVKVRVTMDSGAAGHVMPETMIPTCQT